MWCAALLLLLLLLLLQDTTVSSRLALQGLDWDCVAAADLLLLLQQFLDGLKRPSSSSSSSKPHIKRMQIYISEFGKERVEAEKTKGPAIVRV